MIKDSVNDAGTDLHTIQDSLAYTCSALSFMLQNLGKSVILTGSQAPMVELQNDATDNLLGSLIIAGHFMIPEVCLFFNYNLFRGNRTMKTSASDFAAFSSPNLPPLATISSLRVNVSWDLIYRPKYMEAFSIQTKRATGDVACLRIFPGIRPDMVDAVLKITGLKALVLETFGAGNAPGDGSLAKVLAAAIERGIIIINVTQCMTGTVSPLYEAGAPLRRAGVVPGHDMTTEAALAKLSYLLALPDLTTEDIIRQLSVSLRGEFTEPTNMIFEHPKGILPTGIANLTYLGYAISKGDVAEVQKLLKGDLGWLLNEADYTGNTPLVRILQYLEDHSELTVLCSILRPRDLIWRYYISCFPMAPQCTCATRPIGLPCSSPQMQDALIMFCSSNGREPTFMRMRRRLLAYTLMGHPKSGRPLVFGDVIQTIKGDTVSRYRTGSRIALDSNVFSRHDRSSTDEADWIRLRLPSQ